MHQASLITFSSSPLVFFKRLLWVELLIVAFFALTNVLRINNVLSSEQYPLLDSVVSDTLVVVIFVSIELTGIIIAFVSWFTEKYIVSTVDVRFTRFGLRSRTIINRHEIRRATVTTSLLQNLFHTSTVKLHLADGRTANIRDVADPEKLLDTLDNSPPPASEGVISDALLGADLKTLLKSAETQFVEFKSSLMFDYHLKRANSDLAKPVLKTLTAFLNSSGGVLVIGVSDKGKILGLEKDFATLSKQTADFWQNSLTTSINNAIGAEFHQYLAVDFEKKGKQTVAMVRVKPAPMPAYLRYQGKEEFYIRTGNSSQPLSVAKATTYITTHFRTGLTDSAT